MLIEQRRKIVAVGAAALWGTHATSQAIDSGSFEFANGNRTQIARIGVQWDWQRLWWKSDAMQLGGYWDLSAGGWRQNRFHSVVGETHDIADIGLTPVFRLQANSKICWYAEAGIGVHYLHGTYDNNGRRLSDDFQFGSHIGAGYVFGNRIDIGVRIQHISNGGIKKPNDGVNFEVIRASYRF